LMKFRQVVGCGDVIVGDQDLDAFHETIPRLEPSLECDLLMKPCLGSDKAD
jgi:hypothetical protein